MVSLTDIQKAQRNIKEVIIQTECSFVENFSRQYAANVYFKREDLQVVRSYKIRGAYNRIKKISPQLNGKKIVCASAGNHAQGVALSCQKLGVKGLIFMPVTTPAQKVDRVRMFGGDAVEIILKGDTYDDSYGFAMQTCKEQDAIFAHPFNDPDVIAGQGTVGLEILSQTPQKIDYLFLPIGGGGLASGVAKVFKELSPYTKIIGVEPTGAPSFTTSQKAGENTQLESVDKFVDGASVQKMGALTFKMCNELLDEAITVDEGAICQSILQLYNENAMVVEPAGVLSIVAMQQYKEKLANKNVVCIVSGGNNDITRMEEIKERSLLYAGLKHYFIVRFPQRSGALKEFVVDVLGPDDDITYFEYIKKNNRATAPAVVGIELKRKEAFQTLFERMQHKGFMGEYLNEKPDLLRFIV